MQFDEELNEGNEIASDICIKESFEKTHQKTGKCKEWYNKKM